MTNAIASAPPSTRLLAGRPYLVLGAAACLAHLAMGIWRTSGGYFSSDDFLNFILAAEVEGGWRYFVRSVFGQFAPLYRATNYVIEQLFGMNYAVTRTILLMMSTGTVGLAMALCARVKLPLYATAAAAVFLAVYWLPLEGQDWWSAGLHCIPGAAAMAAAVLLSARQRAPLAMSDRLLIALAFGAGIGFYNAVLLSAPLLGAVRFHARTIVDPSASFLRRAFGALADLAPTVAVAMCAVGFLLVMRPESGGGSGLSLGDLMSAVGVGFIYGLGAGVVGFGGFGAGGEGAVFIIAGILGVMVIVVTPGISIWRRPATSWLWAGLYVFVLLQFTIIGSQRAAEFSVWSMTSTRYNLSNVLAFAMVTIIAFGREHGSAAGAGGRPTKSKSYSADLLPALILCFAPVHIWTGATKNREWVRPDTEPFVAQLQKFSEGGPYHVGDRSMPDGVIPHWVGVYSTLGKYAQVAPTDLDVGSWTNATHFLADDGSLHTISSAPSERWRSEEGEEFSVFVLPEIEAAGAVTHVFDNPSPALSGWMNPFVVADGRTEVVAVDQAGQVHTAVETMNPTPFLLNEFRMGSFTNVGFLIPLSADYTAASARVYILIDRRLAIALPIVQQTEAAVDFPYVDPESLSEPLKIEATLVGEGFSPNGWYPGAGEPVAGFGGWGSQAALGDVGQGAVTLHFTLPEYARGIAIPVITGPNGLGSRFILRNAENKEILAELSNPEGLAQWRLWAPEISQPDRLSVLELEVSDSSSEWGAWVGVGPPRAIE